MKFISKLNRRSFFNLLFTSLFTLILAFFSIKTFSKKTYLRPPGSLNENDFLSRCVSCEKCLQVCHANIISPIKFSTDLHSIKTPEIRFKNGYCDLCMKCVDVCKYGAIKSINKEKVNIGKAIIIKDACIAWGWMGCTVCVDKCPTKAITLDNANHPIIIKELCNGCGLCEYICPSTSLRYTKKGVIVVPNNDERIV